MLEEQSSTEETGLHWGYRTMLKIFVGERFLLECNHWTNHADSHTVSTLLGIRKDLSIRMPQSADWLGKRGRGEGSLFTTQLGYAISSNPESQNEAFKRRFQGKQNFAAETKLH